MTVTELVQWCYDNGRRPEVVQICIVTSPGAVPQIVEMESLDMDEDGDVIIEL